MALKLELKAGERLRLGDCVVVNGGARATLLIEGDTPVLRETEIIEPAHADSAAKRLYLAVQSMHLSRRRGGFLTDYAFHAGEIAAASPALKPLIDTIDDLVAAGRYYKAMRAARHLIDAETRRAA